MIFYQAVLATPFLDKGAIIHGRPKARPRNTHPAQGLRWSLQRRGRPTRDRPHHPTRRWTDPPCPGVLGSQRHVDHHSATGEPDPIPSGPAREHPSGELVRHRLTSHSHPACAKRPGCFNFK